MIEGRPGLGLKGHDIRGKDVLAVRWGAFGDQIVMTPFLRWAAKEGARVHFSVSERGMHVLHGFPWVHKWHQYVSDSVSPDAIMPYLRKLAADNGCEYLFNFCGSIEHALSPHPVDPLYKMPKWERSQRCDRNYYEYMWEHAGFQVPSDTGGLFKPELHFTDQEKSAVGLFMGENVNLGERLMVVCWTGSGPSKMYPWMEYVIGEALQRHKDLVCVVVGAAPVDVTQLWEQSGGRICSRMEHWSFREAAYAAAIADVVVSMDTGILHAAGAFDVPKVGLIGHNSLNNITKHFTNDFSMEADRKIVGCAPCHRIVYVGDMQCPVDPLSGAVWCMAFGLDPAKVADQIDRALEVRHDAAYSRAAAIGVREAVRA